MVRSSAALGVILVSVALSPLAAGGEFPVEEYDRRSAEYISRLDNISVVIKESDHTSDGSDIAFGGIHQFDSIPGYIRVKSVVTQQRAKQAPVVKTEWVLLRPDGCFHVTEKAGGKFLLRAWQKDVNSPLDVDSDSPIRFLVLPVCRLDLPFSYLLHGKFSEHYQIKPVSFEANKPVAGRYALVTEGVSKTSRGETRYELDSEFLFLSMTARSQKTNEGVSYNYEYTDFNGKRLPARITANRFRSDGKLISPGLDLTFGPYSTFKGSQSDFSLDQFGIPETALYATPGRWASRNWLYLLSAAIIFAALSFIFWRRSRRSEPQILGAR